MARVWPVHFLVMHLCWVHLCWDYLTGRDPARVVDQVVAVHLSLLPPVQWREDPSLQRTGLVCCLQLASVMHPFLGRDCTKLVDGTRSGEQLMTG